MNKRPEDLDTTLDPAMKSWLAEANDPACDFPIQNLPMCRFIDAASDHHPELPKIGVAIGDRVLNLDLLLHAGLLGDDETTETIDYALHTGASNYVMDEPALWKRIREKSQAFLRDGHVGQQARRLRDKAVLPMTAVTFVNPCDIGDYPDFYARIPHARNVGAMFRPDNPLLPNYKHIPIGYHGRSSSIVHSGTAIKRPSGQTNTDNAPLPTFGPCKRLDYELEVGCYISAGNVQGDSIPIDHAHEHVFGIGLVNDWSARDVQAWEYQPLGPFLAKNFATSVAPFVVTRGVLELFRLPGPPRESGDPAPLPYLSPAAGGEGADWTLDVHLEVLIETAAMREKKIAPFRVSLGNLKDMYWTFPQMIAHHTSGGCNLEPGDLLASGTVSGPAASSRGCLLEMSWQGNGPDGKPLPRKPIELPSGEKRTFLEDGDRVIMRGWMERPGYPRIGLGSCDGLILPA